MIAIYKTILKSTGRVVYVGQTKNIPTIGKCYFGGGKNIKCFTPDEQRYLFSAEIITTTNSKHVSDDLERYYIEYYCTLEEYGGLNCQLGGRNGNIWNEEYKQLFRDYYNSGKLNK